MSTNNELGTATANAHRQVLMCDQRVSPSGTRYNVQTAISDGVSKSKTNTIPVNMKTTATSA